MPSTSKSRIAFAHLHLDDREFDQGIGSWLFAPWVINLASVSKLLRRMVFDGYVIQKLRISSMSVKELDLAIKVFSFRKDKHDLFHQVKLVI